ncbi:MAG: class I SAM-dependent methyltransferase [Candidatus Yanofskybacteria bacterium]|nr:class I SAM-dependent methyltransferase [Candidatus Yanofskybacteria bacterium]
MTEFEQLIHEYAFTNKNPGKDLFSEKTSKIEQRYREYLDLENLNSTNDTARLINNIATKILKKTGYLDVAEIGSGIGGLAVALAILGKHQVTGIEPEISAIKASRLRAEKYPDIKTSFIQGYGEKIPLPDNSFDLVYSQSVLEHVADVTRVLSEAYRILRPGGVIYIETPNYLWPIEQHYRILFPPLLPKSLAHLYLKLRGKNPAGIDTINYVIPQNISRYLKKTGFIDITDEAFKEYALKLNDLSRIKHKKYLQTLLKLPLSASIFRTTIRSLLTLGLYPGLKISARKIPAR